MTDGVEGHHYQEEVSCGNPAAAEVDAQVLRLQERLQLDKTDSAVSTQKSWAAI